MNTATDFISKNKATWNHKTDFHIASDFYDNESFIQGRNSLNEIELNLLGDLKGKSILHLQCHFGQDSISLARMGASVVGVDFSEKAIAQARDLAKATNADANFVCCNIYDLPQHLNQTFDMVFTSYGTIGWLPDLEKWAAIVVQFLKPNGIFVFAEFHPVVWMYDNDFQEVTYRYFKSEPIVEIEKGTYADRNAPIELESITWNHGIGEVINNLLKQGLQLQSLTEYDYSPYNCFNHTVEFEPNKFRIKHFEDKIPMVYAIVAKKLSI